MSVLAFFYKHIISYTKQVNSDREPSMSASQPKVPCLFLTDLLFELSRSATKICLGLHEGMILDLSSTVLASRSFRTNSWYSYT